MDKIISISAFKDKKRAEAEQAAVEERRLEAEEAEREYKEFIKLLKYFVTIQECKRKLILINKKDGKYTLTDEDAKVLTIGTDEEVARELPPETNTDDLLISRLITISPRLICINTEDMNPELLNTITLVFENVIVL